MNPIMFLVSVTLKATAILLVASALRRLVGERSAAIRHLVGVIALGSIILIPVVQPLVPRLNVPIAFWDRSTFRPVRKGGPTLTSPRQGSNPTGVASSVVSATETTPAEPIDTQSTALLSIWAIGAALVAMRSLAGFWSLRALRAFGTHPMEDDDLAIHRDDLATVAGVSRPWELRRSATEEPASALTWGVRRPVVLLPFSSDGWSRRRQATVLLHELAHVRRYDFLSLILSEIACALYWFHPLVWLGARAMRADAEAAADDVVLQAGVRPSDYAEELLHIAAEIGHRRTLLIQPGVPAMNPTKIETRLQAVLAPRASRRGLTQLHLLSAATAALAIIPAVAAWQSSATTDAAAARQERTEALNRLKQVALGSLMYAADYDDDLPYVQQTASIVEVTKPYVRDLESFKSPTKGGKVLFNLNVGGVSMNAIDEPAATPLWIETLPDAEMTNAVAFVDGHVKLIDKDKRKEVTKAAAKKFPRVASMKPLPKNYMLQTPPVANIGNPSVAVSPAGRG